MKTAFRHASLTILVLIIVVSSGCLSIGKKDEPKLFMKPADEYILTPSQVGNDWTMLDDHAFDADPPEGMDTRYKENFVDGDGYKMVLAVWVMNDIESCISMFDDTQLDFSTTDLKRQDLKIGDVSIGYGGESEAVAIVRVSNVLVVIYCENALLSFAKNLASDQVERINEVG